MFLITREMYETSYRTERRLIIGEYEPRNFIGTSYYFRLGALDEGNYAVPIEDRLTLRANSYMRVWTLESFEMSAYVLALIGPTSTLIGEGIELINAPSIDPGFKGVLQVGLRNNLASPVKIPMFGTIGKAIFFDVSDSTINVDELLLGSKRAELAHRRETATAVHEIFEEEHQHEKQEQPPDADESPGASGRG